MRIPLPTPVPLRAPLALARLTALDVLRQPVFLLLSLTVSAAILLFPLLLNYTLGDAVPVVRDSALSLLWLGGVLLAALSAALTVSRDLSTSAAATLFTRPFPRALYLPAKTLGVAAALLPYALLAALAALLAVRIAGDGLHADWPVAAAALPALPLALLLAALRSRFSSAPFATTALLYSLLALLAATAFAASRPTLDADPFPANLDRPTLLSALLLSAPSLMAAALSAALASRLPPAPAFAIVLALFALGILSASFPHSLLLALCPDVRPFWPPDSPPAAVPLLPPRRALAALAYSLLYASSVLAFAAAAFRTREIPA